MQRDLDRFGFGGACELLEGAQRIRIQAAHGGEIQDQVAVPVVQLLADLLGLGGTTIEEKVNKLIAAVEQLLNQLEFPRSIAELGISKEEFDRAIPELVKAAYDDPSWRSNPRMPLMRELEDLFRKAYQGRGAGRELLPEQKSA